MIVRYFPIFCKWAQKIFEKKKCLLNKIPNKTVSHKFSSLIKKKKFNTICSIFHFFENIIQSKDIFVNRDILIQNFSLMKLLELDDLRFCPMY